MNPTSPSPFSDSPWFWAYLFTAAALVALALIAPKYSARQAQIERQFEGRQRARHTPTIPPAEQVPESTLIPGENRVTLKPLFLGLAALTILIWLVHWRTRSTTVPPSFPTDN